MNESRKNSGTTEVSGASFGCCSDSCSDLLRSSRHLGWSSLLVDHHVIHAADAEYETVCTEDQALAVMTRGEFNLESFNDGMWRKAKYACGTVGLTPGGKVNRLRRKLAKNSEAAEMLKIYLPAGLMAIIGEEYRGAGQQVPKAPLNALSFNDQTIMHTAFSVLRAVRAGASELYAETAAQWLATHLLMSHQPGFSVSSSERDPGPLSDKRLARVLEFIRYHYADRLTLDSLSSEAGISKFHFVKLFRQATGQTPHALVTQIRLGEARQLLLNSELSISEISSACGYKRPTHFATAFSSRYGITPSVFREEQVR